MSWQKKERKNNLLLIFYLFDLFVVYLSWKSFKDIVNPISITSFTWLLFLFLYNIISIGNEGYRKLSTLFYLSVIIYIATFSLVCLLFIKNVKQNQNRNIFNLDTINVSRNLVEGIIWFAILANVYYILTLFNYAGTFNVIDVIYHIRNSARGDGSAAFSSAIKLGSLLFNFSPLILCYVFLYDVKIKKYKVAILISEIFFISLLLATKGRILRFAILMIIILRKKLSKRKFYFSMIIMIPIFIILISILTIGRDHTYFEMYSVEDYIFLYLLSPIPAFDRLISGELSYFSNGFGVRIFSFMYEKIINPLFDINPYYVDPGYIYVTTEHGKITTNVETILGSYYMDFGFVGVIICGLIMGTIFGFSYKKMRSTKKSEYTIFYVLNVPYLFFQTFGDFLMPTFTITVQEFLSAVIIAFVFRKFSIGKKNDRGSV